MLIRSNTTEQITRAGHQHVIFPVYMEPVTVIAYHDQPLVGKNHQQSGQHFRIFYRHGFLY